ncbi:macrophage mannose receptor 1-like [Chironomus tepperi]|uniref:macrophage mannose receptor 1-like n=1 Tax=Chironomus tepperi TaxID=113505 RepID=UPI00391F4442
MYAISVIIWTILIISSASCDDCKHVCSKLPSTSEACSSKAPIVRDTFFLTLGNYGGDDKCGNYYQKIYYFPRYFKASWIEAKIICKTYNLELASFKTLDEANAVMSMVKHNQHLASIDYLFIFLDGIALSQKSTTNWYWTESGEKIGFSIPWLPGQPDTAGNTEYYLSIGRFNKDGQIGFNDVPAKDFINNFLCQRYI